MDTPDDFTGPVNLGNPGKLTIKVLAEKIIEITGSRSTLSYHPLPSDDPLPRKLDIDLARAVLGWEPKIQLEDGLRHTIAYFDRVPAKESGDT